jgi:endonuclease/exonuclease/phosphatase family metal-dependent hydrolase
MPYCASFRAGRFDFVIVNTHIYCGNTKKEKDLRKEEIDKLVEFVLKRSETDKSKVFDKDFFVVGDFNIERLGDRFFDALTLNNKFTMPPHMNTLNTNFNQNKTFDKIAWIKDKHSSFSHTEKCNVVPFGKVVYQDTDPKGGKKQISDHLPLWAEFEINKLTQELDQIINVGV